MTDFKALAGVSSSLRTLLRDRMEQPVTVTIAPPDVSVASVSGRRLNLYLYQVAENAYLKNQEIPGRDSRGAYGHPPLSLNLNYLLTAYGESDVAADGDLQAQQVLGDAMRVLHDFALVSEDLRIRSPAGGTIGDPVLDSSLLGEFEQVKVTLQPATLEEFSKIWTALPQANFRRSVAYEVSVVQIESRATRRPPPVVGEPPAAGPRVYVVPFRSPHVEELRLRRPGDPPGTEHRFPYARIGDTLIVVGHGFASAATRVRLGGVEIPAVPARDDRIEVVIPDDALPDGSIIPAARRLQPGAQAGSVSVGVPALPEAGFRSNQSVFLLVPRISAQPTITMPARTLDIVGSRLFQPSATGETLVGNALIAKDEYVAPAPDHIVMPLPPTLPAWPVDARQSGALAPFPALAALDVDITISGDGPHTATLQSIPGDLTEAAALLQAAIRGATGGGAGFASTRVAAVGDRLVLVPGGPGGVAVANSQAARDLRLTAARGASMRQVLLSGELDPFPAITSVQPQLSATIAGTTRAVSLASRPTTLGQAANLVQAAIQAAGGAAFASTRVATLGSQLIVVPGAAGVVRFEKAVGADELTVGQLQLRATYPVRVRVNGAQSIDDVAMELPA
jgi:hypothetical protein